MAKTKFVLTEKSIPKAWYNIQADLPQPLPPVIHPGTGEPIGPDDLALKIEEVREATNWEIPIQLKLGAARVYDDVRMAVKCGPDSIYIDAMEGGTGAGPHIATEDTGVPGIAAIRQARP